jgi:hypothetical protein
MPLITTNIDLFIGSHDRVRTMPDQTSRQKILAGKLGWYQNLRALLILNPSVILDIPIATIDDALCLSFSLRLILLFLVFCQPRPPKEFEPIEVYSLYVFV